MTLVGVKGTGFVAGSGDHQLMSEVSAIRTCFCCGQSYLTGVSETDMVREMSYQSIQVGSGYFYPTWFPKNCPSHFTQTSHCLIYSFPLLPRLHLQSSGLCTFSVCSQIKS